MTSGERGEGVWAMSLQGKQKEMVTHAQESQMGAAVVNSCPPPPFPTPTFPFLSLALHY